MKGRIEQFARGDFNEQDPIISISDESISMQIEAGTEYSGQISIKSLNDVEIRGRVFASDNSIGIDEHSFIAKEYIVKYTVDAKCLKETDKIDGRIDFITNGCETEIPFHFEIVPPFITTSSRNLYSVDDFVEFAKNNWNEAVSIFANPKFKLVFIKDNVKLNQVYNALENSCSTDEALEEFLVYISEKSIVNLSVEEKNINYLLSEDIEENEIEILKNTWGYVKGYVRSDSNFISVARTIIDKDDFIGSKYMLSYKINPNLIEKGVTKGSIFISTIREEIQVNIFIKSPQIKEEVTPKQLSNRLLLKKNEFSLIDNYLKLRTNNINIDTYIEMSIEAINILKRCSNDQGMYTLAGIHMHILSGNNNLVLQEIKRIDEDSEKILGSSKEKAYYMYLKALEFKDDISIDNAYEQISKLFIEDNTNMFYFWMLLYLDNSLVNDSQKRFTALKQMFIRGVNSPVLYYEVCELFCCDPTLLHEITQLEVSAISWGIKHDYISNDVIEQFVYLCERQKDFSKGIFKTLCRIYEISPSIGCISAICSMLIKGNKVGTKFHIYYKKGVDFGLKLVGLYEYFVRSIDISQYPVLPPAVLMYFNYNNSLNEYELAYLYANLIFNKEKYGAFYDGYIQGIQEFMAQQIEKGAMNDNLAVIYSEFLRPDIVTQEVSCELSNIIFKRKLVCKNRRIKTVSVYHVEIDKEERFPIIDNVAYIDIITENVVVALEDDEGNYYVNSIDYSIENLVEEKDFIDKCYSHNPYDYKILLYLARWSNLIDSTDIKAVNVDCEILDSQFISESTKQNVLFNVIKYYEENFGGSILDEYLAKVDLKYLNYLKRQDIIQLLISEEAYDNALDAIKLYGFSNVDDGLLLKLANYICENENRYGENEVVIKICNILNKKGLNSKATLRYLTKYFAASTKEMTRLWSIANDEGIKARELEENIIAQILFTRGYSNRSNEIFLSYMNNNPKNAIVKAFLKYNAYEYFTKEVVIGDSLINCLIDQIECNNVTEDLYKMIVVYFYSENISKLSYKSDIVINFVKRFIENDCIMPFFLEYKDQIMLPKNMQLKTFLTYRANPNTEVVVHYTFGNEKDNIVRYSREKMKELLPGYYTLEFIVFHNEKLLYYITENRDGKEEITESDGILIDAKLDSDEESRYNNLNYMMICFETSDDETLATEMKNYMNVSHIFDENLKIL